MKAREIRYRTLTMSILDDADDRPLLVRALLFYCVIATDAVR